MSFWNELSPAVKGYIVVGAVILLGLLSFRSCLGGGSTSEPPPRGLQR